MADEYVNIDKQALDLIKYPPKYSPEIFYFSDYDYSSNNLRGKLYQFCYRYIYDTKMKSVFSPYSEVAIPQGEELPNGDFVPDFHLNNAIGVKINMGHFTVDEVEVAYRIGNKGNLYVFDRIKKYERTFVTGTAHHGSNILDNIGRDGGITIEELKIGHKIDIKRAASAPDLYVIKIDVAAGEVYMSENFVTPTSSIPDYNIDEQRWFIDEEEFYVIFRNDKVDYIVPEAEAIESFDKVPIKAGAMEVIESNRIVPGDITTGFDNTVIDAETAFTYTDIPEYTSKFDIDKDFNYGDTYQDSIYIKIPNTLPRKSYVFLNFKFLKASDGLEVNFSVGYYYGENNSDTIADAVAYLVRAIESYNNLIETSHSGPSDINDVPKYNFKAGTLLNDQRYISGVYYDNDTQPNFILNEFYNIGDMVTFSGNIYICKSQTQITGRAPTNTTYWDLFCAVEDKDKTIIIRSSNADNSQRWYKYILSSYGATIYTAQEVHNVFKHGCQVNIAIEYLDYASRLSAANVSDQMLVDVPNMDKLRYTYNHLTNSITLAINNIPPIDAYAYRVLIDRNVPWFFQFFFYGMKHATPDITDDNIHFRIKVNRAIQNLRDYFPKSILSPYLFEKGDRIRLIAFKLEDHLTERLNRWQTYTEVLDAEIIGYDYPEGDETYLKDDTEDHDYILDANGNKIRNISTGYIIVERVYATPQERVVSDDGRREYETYNPLEDAVYVLYEIYRPRKVTDLNTTFWETVKTFPINMPGEEGRLHMGDVIQALPQPHLISQAYPQGYPGHPAQVILDMGNVYRKMRYSGEADIYFPVESMHLSDFYESNDISIGRSNVISEDLGRVHEESAYVWSSTLLEGTAINQLNKFPSENKARLQSKHGAITAFKEKSYILYAFQERKVTSLYIGRQTLIDASDGSESITILKGKVFGSVIPQTSEFGCQNPESVYASQAHVYFWDGNLSKWCRIAYNGIFPVSDYGKAGFFETLNATMKKSSVKRSVALWDNKHEELITAQKYYDVADYYLTVIGMYAIGENKLTGIGRAGGEAIANLQVGMVLTQLTSSEETPEVNATILKVDIPNRIIYLDKVIPFGTGIAGPVEITALILKKFEMNTMAFHEPVNAWKTQYPFCPEFMINYGDEILSFINGRTYLHNSDSVPDNYFYGIQFEQWIQFPFNIEKGMIKLLEGIEYIANKGGWGAIAKGDITIKSFDARGVDMQSMLPAAKFRNVEGKHVSELLRDMNTPNYASESYALVEGRFLRGYAGVIKLTTFETSKTILKEVSIYFTPSL